MQNFGPVYGKLREQKGFSIRESATGTISPQFLRKFEKGTSDIRLSNFIQLLYKSNISIVEFVNEFEDESIDYLIDDLEDRLDQIFTTNNLMQIKDLHKQYKELKEQSDDRKYEHLYQLITYHYQRISGIPTDREKMFEEGTNYLRNVYQWGRYEFFLASYMVMPFSDEELYSITAQIIRRQHKHDANKRHLLDFWLQVVNEFIRRENTKAAEHFLDLYFQQISSGRLIKYMTYDTFANFLKGTILVSKDDPSGVTICKQIIDFYHDVLDNTSYANMLHKHLLRHIEDSNLELDEHL
ncbi:hypothetical protein BAU15_07130 [Enterococcus sp. JM4C]|uniref:helix-turn-helix domain-containing protein n=1 Tax=Candidatus Enterococcus huntleyi TaxID=1857217 RepID=UPI001379F860|nr:hypothetical protein [Enterococcus sp. JM4C]KAF1297481.1 hypothetical protein BAU15_07130 [Enterococcus sp. JM4C]